MLGKRVSYVRDFEIAECAYNATEIRQKASLREGSDVTVELRGDEVVIKRAVPPTKSYVEYYTSTYAKKLKKEVDNKKILEEELPDRTGIR